MHRRAYNFWDAAPCLPPMQPNTRLNEGSCNKNPAPDFSWRSATVVKGALDPESLFMCDNALW